MSHRPDVEELILHAVKDHGCDAVGGIVRLVQQQSLIDASTQTLATPNGRVIDLTDVAADLLFERFAEIHALHDHHHGSDMFEKITEERKVTHA